MTTQNHRKMSATAKPTTTNVSGRKRPPLTNISNNTRPSMVPCTATKNIKVTRGSTRSIGGTNFPEVRSKTAIPRTQTQSDVLASSKVSLPASKGELSRISFRPALCNMDISPTPSNAHSFSMDETTSTSDSAKSPEIEFLDQNDVPALGSTKTITSNNLHVSKHVQTAAFEESFCKREILAAMDIDKIVDGDYMDPQSCSTIACDIYKHLRASEIQKRPSDDFMEKIQKDISANMRAILIDWLVEVVEEYRLLPDTLYLAINYIDRYLSGNAVNRQRLQLLGVACMMVAAKYEEICAPQVEEFCYITDNTYFKDEVLQMESAVLNFLKFEMTAPTTKCFLRRFVRADQAMNEVPSLQLECYANYVAELSLLEYSMLQYAPSLIAASAIFLARYMLSPFNRPWNSTLRHYTLYESSDLEECVKALHELCLNSNSSSLPAIRDKYSQHKYKLVAKMYCPSSIPAEYFQN